MCVCHHSSARIRRDDPIVVRVNRVEHVTQVLVHHPVGAARCDPRIAPHHVLEHVECKAISVCGASNQRFASKINCGSKPINPCAYTYAGCIQLHYTGVIAALTAPGVYNGGCTMSSTLCMGWEHANSGSHVACGHVTASTVFDARKGETSGRVTYLFTGERCTQQVSV